MTRSMIRSALAAALLAVLLVGFQPPRSAAALPLLPGCAVTAGSPISQGSGSFAAVSNLNCSDSVSLLVLGAVLSAEPGTSNANGRNCQNCGNLQVNVGPALALGPIYCVTSKASGNAAGAVVVPPYSQAIYCQDVTLPLP